MMAKPLTNARIIAAYLKLRARKQAFNREVDAINDDYDEKMSRLSAELLHRMNTQGEKSLRTDAGSVIKTTDIIPTVHDWDALYRWIAENDMFEALERRVKKTFVADYMKENNKAIPPGVTVLRSFKAVVKKAPNKRGIIPDGEE